jgi:uncharacterized membrane protein YfcA
MEYWQILLLIIVGAFAGWLNVMAGGGSLLTIPALLFMDIPAPVANGTNRIAILAQNISAFYAFFRKGYCDLKLSLSLSFFASIGAVAGAMLGIKLDGEWFNALLAIVMVAVMIFMATGDKKETEKENVTSKPKNLLLGHFLMIFAGFWGGLIHVGVGFILMPILYRVMGIDLVRVNMYKITIALVFTLVALIIYSSQLELIWWAGLGLAIGNSLGGWLGVHTTIVKGEKWIKMIIYMALSVFIVKLLFFNSH